ncbi:MAG: aminotransferase class V-fold PLP-dependent enzyme [Candidatus Aminicenantes bacterium]|nr:aminotransferase class V-fold PLP-dependent enzyme [Candidatus Aminicenantes bacterium]
MVDLKNDLSKIREQFPVLDKCVYLISNSLGAVPKSTQTELMNYYKLWANEGVNAWKKEWWGLSKNIASKLESFLKAEKQSISMMPNATISHWVALSTKFNAPHRNRGKIIVTELDFPSSIYAVSKIAEFMRWKIETVRSENSVTLEPEKIIRKIDRSTLFIITSHVCFKSGFIQDIHAIAKKARTVGAVTVIDGYHAPGSIPVNLKESGVDFYIGGCLKWLCGGPGNAFLYTRSGFASKATPSLTGWLAHKNPFAFDLQMKYTTGPYRYMSGTPPIPSLYTASAGLNIIQDIGIKTIREKSIFMTEMIINKAQERKFAIHSPLNQKIRGGAVSLNLPSAFQVKQALENRKTYVDFRKGKTRKQDVIRIGPHFYNEEKEISALFDQIDQIYSSGEYKKYSDQIKHVT